MRLGLLGLGKMGGQIAIKLLEAGHEVIINSSNPTTTELMIAKGAISTSSMAEFIQNLGAKPVIWIMIPADAVDSELDQLLPQLAPGTLLVDGGNSDWRLTTERAKRCRDANIHFLDVGTSGGILGLKQGFSMMVGGEVEDFAVIEPVLDVLAQPSGSYAHFGPSGAGHYVKMIHNGVEYGIMQAYAEGYQLLHDGPVPNINLERVGHVWQNGSIVSSGLNQLIHEIYQENPSLDGVDGYVAESGEGQWTFETAEAAKIPVPALTVALQTRRASQAGQVSYATKLLAAMRNKFGGHAINKPGIASGFVPTTMPEVKTPVTEGQAGA